MTLQQEIEMKIETIKSVTTEQKHLEDKISNKFSLKAALELVELLREEKQVIKENK